MRFVFGHCELDAADRRMTVRGAPVRLSDRQRDVLVLLLARAGEVVSKEELLEAGWKDVAVGDNSLEQIVSGLRRLLGARPDGVSLIETVPRRGYRLAADVTRVAARESDAALDALLAPHRAFLEGRAALETLEASAIARARGVFEHALAIAPEQPSAHVGLANACAMQFEMTRADPAPDAAALARAVEHAREACRLDPDSGEAWATLGFVLDRAGDRRDAPAASRRAAALEPDNWRHHLRLSYVTWGEERLRAARRTLALLPDFPLAHWLAATVHVARQAVSEAERELDAGLAAMTASAGTAVRFTPVALHWLRGLLHLAKGDEVLALASFERELACEAEGQLYARECAANTWYAIGALHLHQRRVSEAAAAFRETLVRVPVHPLALAAITATGPSALAARPNAPDTAPSSFEVSLARAAQLVLRADHQGASALVDAALSAAPIGPSGWLLPIEPLFRAWSRPGVWAGVMTRLRSRAA
jgi:DNA-binding winged helix-turn-helix (wHTH) protein